ncbi:MAG: PBSX family phage terminase large subunit [Bacteroidales bacterium]|nr:PBSX family phage terminase large subunit [Bacteroidales bacterium]
MKVDLSNRKLFNEVYIPLLYDDKRYLLIYGGRDSAKSFFAGQKVLIDTMAKPYSRFILVRKVYADIKDSQFQTLRDIIKLYGLGEYFSITENPLKITFKKNGNYIIARGLDKEHKTKSIKDPTGVWYEEMNEIRFQDFIKTTTSLRGGKIQEIGTFNPENETEWINSFFFPDKKSYERDDGNFHYVPSVRSDTTILHTTFRDNYYVTPQSVELLESFRETDDNYYRIYTLGLWGGALEGLVFDDWEVTGTSTSSVTGGEWENADGKLLGYGLDFGYSNDATALVRVSEDGENLYVDEMMYETNLTNQDIADRMSWLGVSRTDDIVADSAEPKSIQELFRMGFNVYPAVKGADSVRNGLDLMKRYKLKVTRRSKNIIRELKNYCWKKDKDGNCLNVPVDKHNHAIDAIRYVLLKKKYLRKKRITRISRLNFN